MSVDTVEIAAKEQDRLQPYAELGLSTDEYEKIVAILERRPTQTELAMYSVMWSEHCSYKSSRVHLRQFADKAPKSDRMLVGMGENASIGDSSATGLYCTRAFGTGHYRARRALA
jgi:phosphoribosylformylglycinamidine (FGAM) synthase-like enzyme